MLVVSPNLRITIPEIRKHPWFLQNLPNYLAQPPEAFLTAQIDNSALAAVAKMGFDPEVVREAVNNKDHNQLTVSYYLSLETLQRKAQKEAEAAGPLAAESIPEVYVHSASPCEGPFAMSEPDTTTPSSSYTGPSFTERAVLLNKASQESTTERDTMQWDFGAIRDECPASEVLGKIYAALKEVGALWRRTAAYALECSITKELGGRARTCIFRVMLFSHVPPRSPRHSNQQQREKATRVIDICCVEGGHMLFQQVCLEFRQIYLQAGSTTRMSE
eukprot:TRINITY_DN10917_c0_g3_i3.p1 TRINITY_DN10917_c0_g3~~TRINITY_DN10917_c0_g3_i3.p1  ORF type:complete len:275 (-),score=58.52 TRINITY_DN10917_c0_g3_i3:74-898(-)